MRTTTRIAFWLLLPVVIVTGSAEAQQLPTYHGRFSSGRTQLARTVRPGVSLQVPARPATPADIVMEIEPNNNSTAAQRLLPPSPAGVTGTADTSDHGSIIVSYGTEYDDIEDLFIVTTASAGLIVSLSGATADLDLFVFTGALDTLVDYAATTGVTDEQIILPSLGSGTYIIGVSIYDPAPAGPPTSPYTLAIIGDLGGGQTPAVDVGVTGMQVTDAVRLGDSTLVSATLYNYGSATQRNFPVSFRVDNGPPVTETFEDSLTARSSRIKLFARTWQPASEGVYHLTAWTSCPGDSNAANDTLATPKSVLVYTPAPHPPGWFAVTPRPTPSSLACVQILNPLSIVAAGSGGTFLKTTNGGVTWNATCIDPQFNASALWFSTPMRGFVVGYDGNAGIIHATTDGGSTWNQPFSNSGFVFYDVSFGDSLHGWAVGHYIYSTWIAVTYRTSNGGTSWSAGPMGTSAYFYGNHFIDATTGWSVGTQILKTTNGGGDWVAQATGLTDALKAVYFRDALTGWAVGNRGTIKATTDGGATWNSQTSGTAENLYAVDFATAQTGWACGAQGTLLRSTDGGTTWMPQSGEGSETLYGIDFMDGRTGWAVGTGGAILGTTTGGEILNDLALGALDLPSVLTTTDTVVLRVVLRNRGTAAQSGFPAGFRIDDEPPVTELHAGSIAGGAMEILEFTHRWTSRTEGSHTVTAWVLLSGDENTLNDTLAEPAIVRAIPPPPHTPGWVAQSPLPTPNSLADVYASGPAGAVIAGTDGVFTTTDAGASWTRRGGSAVSAIKDLCFLTPSTGWCVGNTGRIFRTTDGGVNWAVQTSPTTADLFGVTFTDAQTGWAAGNSGVILKTTDGGLNWFAQTSGTTSQIKAVSAADQQHAWAITRTQVYRTTDGGSTWGVAKSMSSFAFLEDIRFVNPLKGFVTGYADGGANLLQSTDGGLTWASLGASFGWGKRITLIDESNVYFAGITATGINIYDDGWGGVSVNIDGAAWALWRTSNGGAAWATTTFGMSGWLLGASVCGGAGGASVWAVSDRGAIVRTADGCVTWAVCNQGVIRKIYGVSVADGRTAWAVGEYGTLVKTANGGLSWSQQQCNSSATLYGVKFLNLMTGWAVGSGGTILATTDGGLRWMSQRSGVGDGLLGLDFADASTGWAVGYGRILKTTNGGSDWIIKPPPVSTTFNSISCAGASHAWIAVSGGRVLKTIDGGTTWTQPSTGTTNTLYGICFVDTLTGWAVGESGRIISTTDGGESWGNQTSGTTGTLYSVRFCDRQKGWIVGAAGRIMATTNGGSSWEGQSSGTGAELRSVDFFGGRSGWAGGAGGVILATVTGGSLVPVAEEPGRPMAFALFQNYPNPFNPSTVIRFSLPATARVFLEVFDMLGRRVEVLVDESRAAGTYEVLFRGERLASGVYFYRLRAGGFTETKKLLLLK